MEEIKQIYTMCCTKIHTFQKVNQQKTFFSLVLFKTLYKLARESVQKHAFFVHLVFILHGLMCNHKCNKIEQSIIKG